MVDQDLDGEVQEIHLRGNTGKALVLTKLDAEMLLDQLTYFLHRPGTNGHTKENPGLYSQ